MDSNGEICSCELFTLTHLCMCVRAICMQACILHTLIHGCLSFMHNATATMHFLLFTVRCSMFFCISASIVMIQSQSMRAHGMVKLKYGNVASVFSYRHEFIFFTKFSCCCCCCCYSHLFYFNLFLFSFSFSFSF